MYKDTDTLMYGLIRKYLGIQSFKATKENNDIFIRGKISVIIDIGNACIHITNTDVKNKKGRVYVLGKSINTICKNIQRDIDYAESLKGGN